MTACEVAPRSGGVPTYCPANWGSHGCRRRPGHRGAHWCCCGRPRLHKLLGLLGARFVIRFHHGCVGTWPYYGRSTRFYR